MTNEANNIVKQAKQGSVAAIIQVLNEKLADSGVRTRAIFADGVLQLLCEGATLEQLEQTSLVERIRHTLETIAPRNIRRVKINSRIVREQQLLWLEEINRDPDHQLLWSEEIVLKKPGFFKQLSEDWSARGAEPSRTDVTKAAPSPRQQREQRQFWRGLIGGAIASCLLLAGGWWLYNRFGSSEMATQKGGTSVPSQTGVTSSSTTTPTAAAADPFAEAVRLAERTSASGRTAKTSADWLGLASQWQQASDLMAAVPASDYRYKTAQSRVTDYRKNSEISLEKAKEVQATSSTEAAPTEPAVR